MTRLVWPLAIAGLIAGAATARAERLQLDACADAAMLAPAEVGVRVTGFDAPRSPCPAPAMYWRNRGHLRIETGDFYGAVGASSTLGVRIEMAESFLGRYEVELGARIIDYQFVQTAVVTANELSVGPLFIGAVFPYHTGETFAFGSSARVEVQATDTGDERQAVSVSGAAHLLWAPGDAIAVHGRAAAVTDLDRVAMPISADVTLSPARSFAWSIGLETQAGWYELDDEWIDHVLARTALRLRRGVHRFELAGGFAAFGADRPTGVAQLTYAYEL